MCVCDEESSVVCCVLAWIDVQKRSPLFYIRLNLRDTNNEKKQHTDTQQTHEQQNREK